MAKLKCVECSATFTEREIRSDALLCPSCGGRLEEDSGSTENGSRKYSHEQQNQSSSRTNKIQTHYDNLKVPRNAPLEVIRAAYRTLSQKYHPDLNQSNPEAAKIMRIINAAYEVLSDPEKRRAHDQWIAQQEKAIPRTETSQNQTKHTSTPHSTRIPSNTNGIKTGDLFKHIGKNWLWYTLTGLMLWGLATNKPIPPPPGPKPYQATPPAPVKQAYVRPSTAPNGQPWPPSAAYVPGYQRHNTNGRSKVTVDNSQNDSDVFVKLVSIDSDKAYPVRTFYIPGHGSITLNKVSAGSYDIRYRDLETGQLSRSEAFDLKEIRKDDRIQFSNMTMTLYKVRDGNMQTYPLAEEEF
jgi:curved DNA-binding protein CbpA